MFQAVDCESKCFFLRTMLSFGDYMQFEGGKVWFYYPRMNVSSLKSEIYSCEEDS